MQKKICLLYSVSHIVFYLHKCPGGKLVEMPKANYVPHRRGGGHIVFGVDPVSVGVGVTLSCLHNIS